MFFQSILNRLRMIFRKNVPVRARIRVNITPSPLDQLPPHEQQRVRRMLAILGELVPLDIECNQAAKGRRYVELRQELEELQKQH